jgi:transposase
LGARDWARELLKLGHDVRIMPAAYVKPYVRRQKNGAADAAGICEAVTRPSMRFISVRTLENRAVLMHHKTREMLVAQRTQPVNALRGHLAEIGVIAAQGSGTRGHWRGLLRRKTTRRSRPACAGRSPRSGVNRTLWIRRSRAAIAPLPRWLETTQRRAGS